jgi:hypothetical protein
MMKGFTMENVHVIKDDLFRFFEILLHIIFMQGVYVKDAFHEARFEIALC